MATLHTRLLCLTPCGYDGGQPSTWLCSGQVGLHEGFMTKGVLVFNLLTRMWKMQTLTRVSVCKLARSKGLGCAVPAVCVFLCSL